MSDKLYRLFSALLPKFRVDPERKGRCLGELVRRNVSREFPKGGNTALADVKQWEANYKALEAIAGNVDQKAFSRTHVSSSSGFTLEHTTAIITEFNRTLSGSEHFGEEVTSDLKEPGPGRTQS